jgi:hypothetical protein
MICKECGKPEANPDKYSNCPEKAIMQDKTLCFYCAFWHVLARNSKNKELVIDGHTYSIGREPTPGGDKWGLGFGGRRFDIEFNDGRKVTTHNLWAGSVVPERWRSEFPDTAKFLNGAKKVQVGEITCWQESRG